MASLNIDTMELVRLPEEYQNFYMMYDEGYGELVALTNYQEGLTTYKYAICKRDQVLTGEKYLRIYLHSPYYTAQTRTNPVD